MVVTEGRIRRIGFSCEEVITKSLILGSIFASELLNWMKLYLDKKSAICSHTSFGMFNTSEISSIECASSSKARYSSSSSILDFNGTHKLGNRQTSIKYIPTRVTISTYYQKAVSIRIYETQESKNEPVNSYFEFLV